MAKTGDIGYMDADGYVYFVDRLKRMVKISGVNVFPQEIEDCVNKFDGVLRSCIVSYKDGGKTFLKLYVVLDDGIVGDESYLDALRAHIAENLLKYNMPKIIETVKSLPFDPNRKGRLLRYCKTGKTKNPYNCLNIRRTFVFNRYSVDEICDFRIVASVVFINFFYRKSIIFPT